MADRCLPFRFFHHLQIRQHLNSGTARISLSLSLWICFKNYSGSQNRYSLAIAKSLPGLKIDSNGRHNIVVADDGSTQILLFY
jgi:hypothetical protein